MPSIEKGFDFEAVCPGDTTVLSLFFHDGAFLSSAWRGGAGSQGGVSVMFSAVAAGPCGSGAGPALVERRGGHAYGMKTFGACPSRETVQTAKAVRGEPGRLF